MKLARNKDTGKLFCLHCKSYDCICLTEGKDLLGECLSTELKVKSIEEISATEQRITFCKQDLPNGRIIKGSLDVPWYKWRHVICRDRKKILLSNDIINKSFY